MAIGTKPRLATSAVIRTGRKRVSEPSMTASRIVRLCSRSWLKYVIITRPLSTATPLNAMNPTAAVMLKGIPRNQSERTASNGERDSGVNKQRLAKAPECEENQNEDQGERRWHNDRQACAGLL